MENNPLWHERDLTNSSCERIMFPEACILTDYILNLTIKLMNNLIFYDENIERNLNFTNGLIMAERLMAELTRAGMGNLEDPDASQFLTKEDVERIMDPHTYIGSAPIIVDEILESSKDWF